MVQAADIAHDAVRRDAAENHTKDAREQERHAIIPLFWTLIRMDALVAVACILSSAACGNDERRPSSGFGRIQVICRGDDLVAVVELTTIKWRGSLASPNRTSTVSARVLLTFTCDQVLDTSYLTDPVLTAAEMIDLVQLDGRLYVIPHGRPREMPVLQFTEGRFDRVSKNESERLLQAIRDDHEDHPTGNPESAVLDGRFVPSSATVRCDRAAAVISVVREGTGSALSVECDRKDGTHTLRLLGSGGGRDLKAH